MFVVIMGAWNREQQSDIKLVNDLIDDLGRRYGQSLIVVTSGCEKGIGRTIKTRLMPKTRQDHQGEYGFIEVSTRICIEDTPKTMLAAIFTARNATLFELGDEFHLFLGKDQKGHIQDLLERVITCGNIPFAIYRQDDKAGPKMAVMASQQKAEKGA